MIEIMISVSVIYDGAIGTSAFVISNFYQNDECLTHVSTLVTFRTWLLWMGTFHYLTIVMRGICIYKPQSKWVRMMLLLRLGVGWALWIIGVSFFTRLIAVYCKGPLYDFAVIYIVLELLFMAMDGIWLWYHNGH